FFGPTGGFLLGFVLMAAINGLAVDRGSNQLPWIKGVGLGLLSILALYAAGVIWLKSTLGMELSKAVAVGALPFLPGDIVKLFLAIATYRYMSSHRLLPS
ncbi:MAG: biotin transporter BioY, partial [Deltaproteobacteria bacterium]|nr:biotin transporter BioY [Deltaproteobacteria bacterium]